MKKIKNCGSSHQRCFACKSIDRFLYDEEHWSWPATLLKKRLWHRCFPVNFAKFLRTPFLQNTSGRLLLKLAQHKPRKDHNCCRNTRTVIGVFKSYCFSLCFLRNSNLITCSKKFHIN